MVTSLADGLLPSWVLETADSRPEVEATPHQASERLDPDTEQEMTPPPPGRLPVTVRRAVLADLPSLFQLPVVLPLQQPDLSLTGYRLTTTVARSFAPWAKNRPLVFVAKSGSRLVGFVHFQSVGSDRRWCLIGMGSGTGVYEAYPVWTELLRAGVRESGLEGVKRLYARAPVGSAAIRALNAVGFTSYAEEIVYIADQSLTLFETVGLRQQEASDTWAIHQLYNSSVPQQVLYAEARTSHYWDIDESRFSRGTNVKGWLVEDRYSPVAYVRSTVDGSVAMLEVTYAPGAAGTAAALTDTVVRRLRHDRKVTRVFCAVRTYQQEFGSMLVQRGFAPSLEQYVFIKYTTAPVRGTVGEVVPLPVEGVERIPSRVPTYFQGTTGETPSLDPKGGV